MQLERDTLLREKGGLQAELNNRNDIIHHLQDHVVSDFDMRPMPVASCEPALTLVGQCGSRHCHAAKI